MERRARAVASVTGTAARTTSAPGVTYVSPQEMLVALDSGGVVMLDLVRISQDETRRITQDDYVTVTDFIRRPSHRVIATSIQRASPWIPTTPSWAP